MVVEEKVRRGNNKKRGEETRRGEEMRERGKRRRGEETRRGEEKEEERLLIVLSVTSLSSRFFSDSSLWASSGCSRCRGRTYCSSFSSSSFSLIRMRRSRSGSSRPGHASLSSLAICTSMWILSGDDVGYWDCRSAKTAH
ncbi:hypothetical protein EYF80_025153 [Liparis tanakae]|uniref:Uncharacterized protein n=1 Tax=Liparis tanakae TaxID=230148 RepID=A0A4Z2HIA2_9TELE|nr:hypothetical protein EYF80_025153 [Liparis tanakae]